jgi:hypothetical protein
MRLATILPENSDIPVAAVSVDAQNWVGLHSFLAFFGMKDLPANSEAPLDYFLPLLMPRFSELTRKVSDWPEHGRILQKRGGKTLRARWFLANNSSASSFRDFYAFGPRRRGTTLPASSIQDAESSARFLIGVRDRDRWGGAGCRQGIWQFGSPFALGGATLGVFCRLQIMRFFYFD